jgi:hypothetical protein
MVADHEAMAAEPRPRRATVASALAIAALGAGGAALRVWNHGPDARQAAWILVLGALVWGIAGQLLRRFAAQLVAGAAIAAAVLALTHGSIGGRPAVIAIAATAVATIAVPSPRNHTSILLLLVADALWWWAAATAPTLLLIGLAAAALALASRWAPADQLEASLRSFGAAVRRRGVATARSTGARIAVGGRAVARAARRLRIPTDSVGSPPRRGAADTRLAELTTFERIVLGIVVTAAVAAVAVGSIAAARAGWSPVGDEALVQVGALDIGTAATPAVGMSTSSTVYVPGLGSWHPGPLIYVWYSPFVHLWPGAGLLVGMAVLSAACLLGVAWVGLRLNGPTGSLVALGALLAGIVAVGGTAYTYHPINAIAVLLPAYLFLVLSWALLRRRAAALAPWVLAGSFVIQGDLQWAPLVAAAAAVVVLDRIREVGVIRIAPVTTRGRRWLALAGVVAAACWALPLAEALANHGGNLDALLRFFRELDTATLGVGEAVREAAALLAFRPRTLIGEPARTAVVVVGAAVFFVLVGVVVVGWRRATSDGHRLLFLASAALAGSVAGLAGTPVGYGVAPFRVLPVTITAAFFVAATALALLGRARSSRLVGVAAVVALALATAAGVMSPIDPRLEYGEWTYRVAPELAHDVLGKIEPGAYQVQYSGPTSFQMLRDGVSLAVDSAPGFSTDIRRSPPVHHRGPAKWDGQILIAPGFAKPPDGWELVARSAWGDHDPRRVVAGEAARFLTEHDATLTPLADGTGSSNPGARVLFCPELAFDATLRCPMTARDLAAGGTAALPEWVQAVLLLEQHQGILVLDAPDPPPGLLARVRKAYEELPVSVYVRRIR